MRGESALAVLVIWNGSTVVIPDSDVPACFHDHLTKVARRNAVRREVACDEIL
jgi:hypothetical protein